MPMESRCRFLLEQCLQPATEQFSSKKIQWTFTWTHGDPERSHVGHHKARNFLHHMPPQKQKHTDCIPNRTFLINFKIDMLSFFYSDIAISQYTFKISLDSSCICRNTIKAMHCCNMASESTWSRWKNVDKKHNYVDSPCVSYLFC